MSITIGEIIKRGSLDEFSKAFDIVKIGADDLKNAIAVQKIKADFLSAVSVAGERFNADQKELGSTPEENGMGWLYPKGNAEKFKAAQKRTLDYHTEQIPIGDESTIIVTNNEHLRKIIDADANMILAGIIKIPILE